MWFQETGLSIPPHLHIPSASISVLPSSWWRGSPFNRDSKAKVQTSSLFLQTKSTWTGTSACSWTLALWGPHTLSWMVCFPEGKKKNRSFFLKIKFSLLECHCGTSWEGGTICAFCCTALLRRTAIPTVSSQHIRRVPALGQPLVGTSYLRTLTCRRKGGHGRPELQLPRDTLLMVWSWDGFKPFPRPSTRFSFQLNAGRPLF